MALHDERVAMISPWMKNGNLSWYISRHPEVDRYNLVNVISFEKLRLKADGSSDCANRSGRGLLEREWDGECRALIDIHPG